MKRVLVAMSGGVDSSFVVSILSKRGFCVSGATMILSDEFDKDNVKLAEQVMKVCDCYGDYVVLDYSDEFKNQIISRFVKFYELGLTPNPCVWCNASFKFGRLLDYAIEHGFDYLATGHYAKIEYSNRRGCYVLKKAADEMKDQTYFLFLLNQKQLSRLMFPLGDLKKSDIKQQAKYEGIKSAENSESQDVCFIKNIHYVDFIKKTTNRNYSHGNFVDEYGNVLGQHSGIINYTVGQRKGLGLSLKQPMYVKRINCLANEVVLSDRQGLNVKRIWLNGVNIISGREIDSKIEVEVKTRYSPVQYKAKVRFFSDETAQVEFELEQIAPSKGQAVVFYDGLEVVGGGFVCGFD